MKREREGCLPIGKLSTDLQTDWHMELSEKDYIHFRDFIYEKSGINLHKGKKELLKARLVKYLRRSNFQSLGEYYRYLMEKDQNGEECVNLLNSISTNLTYFFREPAHFEFLADVALPKLVASRNRWQKRLDFWSAGCSSGEEAYSLSMVIRENLDCDREWEPNILATDISTKVLGRAMEGIYSAEKLEKIPIDLKRRHFQKGVNGWNGYFKVKGPTRKPVTFERFNLMDEFPSGRLFDVIFCRNVMIYFDKPTQGKIVNKFHRALRPEGYLFIGHAESLTGISNPFHYIRPSVYRK